MKHKIRLATVFSGIGAAEQALKNLRISFETVFACDNGERSLPVDVEEVRASLKGMTIREQQIHVERLYNTTRRPNRVKETYLMNHELSPSSWYEDIRFIDGKSHHGEVDLIVGGSPCQPFSIIGKRGGFNDTRGTLFYDYARLIDEIRPKAFIFENVGGLLSHAGGTTWRTMENVFKNDIGYRIFGPALLNAKDFGIPQDRKRVFVIGFREDIKVFSIPERTIPAGSIDRYLEKGQVDAKHYLGEKGFKFVTAEKYKNRARILGNMMQTQKANQQFNWNGDFVFQPLEEVEGNPEIEARAYVGTYKGQKGVIRQLTHRECHRLMGYPDSFRINTNNVAAYRQAGNSIVVPVLEALIKAITEVLDLDA
jgi:DNA (cytosine-5)-methyltransferase 1